MKRSSASHCQVIQCHELQGSAWVLAQSNYNKGEIVRTFSITGKKLTPFGQFDGNKQIIRESLVNPQSNMMVTSGENGFLTVWSLGASGSLGESSKPKKKKKDRKSKPY